MTAAIASPRRRDRRARGMGVFFVLVALAMLSLFALSADPGASSSFGLNSRASDIELPPLELPSRATALTLALIVGFLGGVQLARGFGHRTYAVLAVVVACFVIAFLVWAARGNSLNLVGMLSSTLLRATPITLGALCGVLCERAGVINIAIEGMMLVAAFSGSLVASASGSKGVGLVGAALLGALLGALLAVLAIRYRVDQIVAGTVLNIFALGLTSYLSARIFSSYQALNSPGTFGPIEIPMLAEIPVIGPLLFVNNIFVYMTFALIALIHFGLFRTRWGLRVRAVGEHPRAADTVGIDVLRVRYRNVILGGAVAGLAGAFLTIGAVGRFDEGMTAGKGFIALAAMIFGRWNPIGAFGAALVFGFADSLQNKLAILNVPIPSEFLLMAPYLVTILVVAGVVGRARPPAADGQPYIK